MAPTPGEEDDSVTVGCGNVFRDLNLENPEQLLVQATLAIDIRETIRRKRLSVAAAARKAESPEETIKAIMKMELDRLDDVSLIDILTALGRDVEIVVRDAPRGKRGQISFPHLSTEFPPP